MIRRKASVFIPLGMAGLVAGIVLRQWPGGNYWHFATGFLLRLGIVVMIEALVKQRRSAVRRASGGQDPKVSTRTN